MKEGPDFTYIAALIGEPARANILSALMSGKALTASELAQEAGVTVQTTSSHLTKLRQGGLLCLRKQGRHKYFSLANDDVAHLLEALMGLAAGAGHLRTRTGPKDVMLRKARVCYNHLAGDMGTELFAALSAKGHLQKTGDDLDLSPSGAALMTEFGIDLWALKQKKSPLCRECLDWSERRYHLAGNLGRAFLQRVEELSWARRDPSSRAIRFSPEGEKRFRALLES